MKSSYNKWNKISQALSQRENLNDYAFVPGIYDEAQPIFV